MVMDKWVQQTYLKITDTPFVFHSDNAYALLQYAIRIVVRH